MRSRAEAFFSAGIAGWELHLPGFGQDYPTGFPMYVFHSGILFSVLFFSVMLTAADSPKHGSTILKFEELSVKSTGVGERREVTDQPTATLDQLESHISTLNPGLASHIPHTHPQEELIILRDGTLDVDRNGQLQHVGPGSMCFFASNQPHAVQNHGEKPATYFVFNFTTAATRRAPAVGAPSLPGRLGSVAWEWAALPVIPTPKGERREVVDSPTATLANFECHITTIKPGEVPHASHHHPDEEIVLLKEGQLDVTINGRTQTASPGSILFFASNDEHGLKNSGTANATYYVMRIVTAATPKLALK